MTRPKKILITGSCGFIFGNFIRRAIYEKQPYQFVSVDRVNSNATNSMYWNKNHIFHVADIRDQHVMDVIFQFEKPDIVIHGADEQDIGNNSFLTSNIIGTQNIIECCLKHQIEKLIYISTDKVYGQLSSYTSPSWLEGDYPRPNSPYAISKLTGEQLVVAAHSTRRLIYNIVRLANNYGPRQRPDSLIPKTIKCILEEQKIPLYGQGALDRSWVHVFDTCSALSTILSQGQPNEIYNISAQQDLPNIEVVQRICNVMKKGHDLISFVDDNKPHDFRRSMNGSKLQKIGWKPTYKFKDGIDKTIEWFLNNQWYLK